MLNISISDNAFSIKYDWFVVYCPEGYIDYNLTIMGGSCMYIYISYRYDIYIYTYNYVYSLYIYIYTYVCIYIYMYTYMYIQI